MHKRISMLFLSVLLSSPIIRACESNQTSLFDKDLAQAIETRDLDAVKNYEGNGINSAGDKWHSCPLNQAVSKGYIEIVDALLEKGAKPIEGKNIITFALNNWKESMAHHLLTRGLQPDITTARAAIGSSSILARCMPPTFDINAPDRTTGNTLLMESLEQNGDGNVSYLLLRNGARADIANKKGWLPIHGAVMKGLFSVVTMILQQNKDCAVTPATLTVAGDNIEIVPLELYSIPQHPDARIADELVKAGASAEKVDLGRVLLNIKSKDCADTVFKKLRALRVCTTTVNKLGQTPLMIALSKGFESVAKQLMDEQDSPKTEDNQKTTLLHFAAKGNLFKLVNTIVTKYGISVDAVDKKGDTPFTIAESCSSDSGEFSDALESMKTKEASTREKRKSYDSKAEQELFGKKIRFAISKDYENCDE